MVAASSESLFQQTRSDTRIHPYTDTPRSTITACATVYVYTHIRIHQHEHTRDATRRARRVSAPSRGATLATRAIACARAHPRVQHWIAVRCVFSAIFTLSLAGDPARRPSRACVCSSCWFRARPVVIIIPHFGWCARCVCDR